MRRVCLVLMLVLSVVCAVCFYQYYQIKRDYAVGRETYSEAVEEYVGVVSEPVEISVEPVEVAEESVEASEEPVEVLPEVPISVDFEALKTDCPDICGWIYCEGTNINYPVVQGESNIEYLRHDYLGGYSVSGSIFVDAQNSVGFQDVNNIIYGHCMKDGAMFACLSKWAKQEFYDEHPVMWLLTPEQDYKIEIFSSYVTYALSGAHTIYKQSDESFSAYLEQAVKNSNISTAVELEDGVKYVMLSTCNYSFDDARFVVHGKLVPINGR